MQFYLIAPGVAEGGVLNIEALLELFNPTRLVLAGLRGERRDWLRAISVDRRALPGLSADWGLVVLAVRGVVPTLRSRS